MKRIVIESKYRETTPEKITKNESFARAVNRWALLKGYAPYASHLYYTQKGILDDTIFEERTCGIDAGLSWSTLAEEAWFCFRRGQEMSEGMLYALDRHRKANVMYFFYIFDGYFNKDGSFTITDRSELSDLLD